MIANAFKAITEEFQTFLVIWVVVLLVNQLFIFHGCFAPYCLIAALPHTGVIAALLTFWLRHSSKDSSTQEYPWETSFTEDEAKPTIQKRDLSIEKPDPVYDWVKQEAYKELIRELEPLKSMGDAYEIHIGRKFERKGDLVIYNGLLRGFKDQGVDLIVISRKDRSVNLVQCKNWKKYEFTVEHLFSIYNRLSHYRPDFYDLPADGIRHYLAISLTDEEISTLLEASRNYVTRKSLYLASIEVLNNQAFAQLTHVDRNIYRYKDLKIVFHSL